MKEKINKIKELWKIPRYKALLKLVFFGIFFLFIYLFILIVSLVNGKTEIITKTTLENYNEMTSYEYTYNINYILNNETLQKKITGTKYNNENIFKILSNKYYIENNFIYDYNTKEVINNLNEYDLLNLETNKISELINSSTDKNVTKYNDGKIKTEYKNENIILITYEENNYIYKIDLDLTTLLNDTNKKITYYNIEINYDNINNITSYN